MAIQLSYSRLSEETFAIADLPKCQTVATVDFGYGSLKIGGYKFSAKIITQKSGNLHELAYF
jgi:hypothetical protein